MKLRLTLDTAAIGVLAFFAVLLGATIFIGKQAGIRVTTNLAEAVSPFQVIELNFSEAVGSAVVEKLFSIQPAIDGKFKWVDSRTLQFTPAQPFKLDTAYKAVLRKGDVFKSDKTLGFRVRDPLVAYIFSGYEESSLRVMDLKNNPPRQLTPADIKVISFDASYDGEFLIFASGNEKNGVDLWRVSRAGNDSTLTLDCGRDRCTTPVISPDGARVAYSREEAGAMPDLPFGSPRIWILDLQNRQTSPVYADRQILGYAPVWSPDARKIISFDGLADQYRLLDISSGEQLIFPSNTGGAVTWSPNSKKFLFTDTIKKDNNVITRVRLADLSLKDTSSLLGENDFRDYAYYSLAWSPVEDSFVLGLRASETDPAQVFALIDVGILDGALIADQKDYTYNSPRWDPYGNALVFQQFKLREAFKPEIGLWKSDFDDPQILTEGITPEWLP